MAAKQRAKMLSVLLAEREHEQLEQVAQEFGVKKSELVRSLIQGAYVAHSINKQIEAGNRNVSVVFGGYGYHIDFEAIKALFSDIAETFASKTEELPKAVKVTMPKHEGVLMNRRAKTPKMRQSDKKIA